MQLYTAGQLGNGPSAVKELGHFEVRKSSSQLIRSQGRCQDFLCCALLSSKKSTFFSRRPKNTGRCRLFTVKMEQIKRSNMVTFLFFVHTITEPKQ